MRLDRRGLVAVVAGGLLLLPACRDVATETTTESEPYRLQAVEGTDVSRVILTADGAARIGLETEQVEGSNGRTTVPASSIWIDVDGQEWVYTSPEPLTYVREEVSVDRYRGETAMLSEGPPAGTEVVTLGVAELVGSEFGI
jgi:hypothetical protein